MVNDPYQLESCTPIRPTRGSAPNWLTSCRGWLIAREQTAATSVQQADASHGGSDAGLEAAQGSTTFAIGVGFAGAALVLALAAFYWRRRRGS